MEHGLFSLVGAGLGPDPTWIFLGVLGLIGLLSALHWFWFIALPTRWLKRLARGNPPREKQLLEWIEASPALLGDAMKVAVRMRLVYVYEREHRFDAVERLCRKMLAHRLPRGLESTIRAHLADALDALGRRAESESERERIQEVLAGTLDKPLEQLARGNLLMSQDRHAEACEAYEQGLGIVPVDKPDFRLKFMNKLAIAALRAGRPADALSWADQAIAGGAGQPWLSLMHRMAALACSNMGRLEESERHLHLAEDAARARGDSAGVSQCLALLANLAHHRGQFEQAFTLCRQAAAMDHEACRPAWLLEAELHRLQGRYDEAISLLARAQEAPQHGKAAAARQGQAVCMLSAAWIEAERGQGERAWTLLQQALGELGNDAKLGLWCDGTAAWVCALLGRRAQAERIYAQAAPRIDALGDDRATQLNLHALLGKASFALGDYARAAEHWEAFLTHAPEAVNRPSGGYYLGEARLKLGDLAGAREAFGDSVAVGIDSHHARLARERLQTT